MKSCSFGIGILCLICGTALASGPSDPSMAEQLVADALRAEVAGDAARREMLLDQAVAVAPENRLARWQRGEIETDGQWQPIEQLQQAAAADPRRAEYLRQRESAGDSLDAQLALARWCRKNNLDDEAWFHWANVVAKQPGNQEALRALGMRWYQNRLLTHEQIDQAKRRAREARRAAKQWAPQVTKWQRAIADDLPAREEALAEIRALADRDAIPALEDVTLGADVSTDLELVRCRQISRAFIDALTETSVQEATESLVRHALFSPVADVRDAAIAALHERPLHDFVPMLLDALAVPLESSFSVTTDPDGSVHYRHSLYRVGPTADWSVNVTRAAWQHFLPLPSDVDVARDGLLTPPEVTRRAVAARRKDVNAVGFQRDFVNQAAVVEQQVAEHNQKVAALNERIVPVLASTTGEDFGDEPRQWWDWWQDYNHYYGPDERPVYERQQIDIGHYYYPPPNMMSCFAEGTLVWTNTGPRAIETLQIGDLVLAQAVDTGELAYKPVVGRTVRPPTEILKLKIGGENGEELQTTLGHPLWVAGIGWRMAKLVGDDAILHGVDGPVRVEAVEPAGEAEAYNLIVADFNSYFVGESGILVHDNTPRQPTTAVVPGLVGK